MFITARDLCGRSQQHFTLTPEDTEVGGAVTLWSREWQGVQAAGSSSGLPLPRPTTVHPPLRPQVYNL